MVRTNKKNSVKLQIQNQHTEKQLFLYTNNKIPKKINNSIYNTITIKDIRINLTKDIKDLNSENYKTLRKETE